MYWGCVSNSSLHALLATKLTLAHFKNVLMSHQKEHEQLVLAWVQKEMDSHSLLVEMLIGPVFWENYMDIPLKNLGIELLFDHQLTSWNIQQRLPNKI